MNFHVPFLSHLQTRCNVLTKRLLQGFALGLFAIFCVGFSGSALAQSPSYVGPYVFFKENYTTGGNTYCSDVAACAKIYVDANINRGVCNARYTLGEWTPYHFVDGVAGSGSQPISIFGWQGNNAGSCHYEVPEQQVSAGIIYRSRVVCSYHEIFADGKCVWFSYVNVPGRNGDNNGPSCPSCGKPINPVTGNMWHRFTDYQAVKPNGLTMQRVYNSRAFSVDALPVHTFGRGWTNSYGTHLQETWAPDPADEVCKQRTDTGEIFCSSWFNYMSPLPFAVSVTRADGKSYNFTRSNNVWIGVANANDRVVPTFSPDNTSVIAWTYISSNGDKLERYDANGTLVSITARNGSVERLTYSTGSTNDTSVARSPVDAPICASFQTDIVLPAGRLMCVTDNSGGQLQFKYDLKGRVVEMIDPAHQSYLYEYDGPSGGCVAGSENSLACSSNNLTKLSFPDGKHQTYYYNESTRINDGATCPNLISIGNGFGPLPNALTGMIDENEDRYLSWTYSCDFKATSSEVANGLEKVALAYGPRYSTGESSTTVTHFTGTSAAPQTTVSTFSNQYMQGVGRNIGVSQNCVECGAKARTYDANGNNATSWDWNNNLTTYAYDLTRNLETSRVEASGTPSARTISTKWHAKFRIPVQIDEPLHRTVYTHDANGNVLTKTEQATSDVNGSQGAAAALVGTARKWTYTYNTLGQVLTLDGPRTDVVDKTTYTYDAQGNLATISNAAGHITTLANYDAHGHVGSITDPNGVVTTLSYHPRGWLASRTVSAGTLVETTGYDYDGVGKMTMVTLPDNSKINYTYDDAHRLTDISDSHQNSIHYELDNMGNRIHETIKGSSGDIQRQVSRVFDALNRLQQVTGGAQ